MAPISVYEDADVSSGSLLEVYYPATADLVSSVFCQIFPGSQTAFEQNIQKPYTKFKRSVPSEQ